MNCFVSPVIFKDFHLLNEHIKDPKYKTEMCKNWENTDLALTITNVDLLMEKKNL